MSCRSLRCTSRQLQRTEIVAPKGYWLAEATEGDGGGHEGCGLSSFPANGDEFSHRVPASTTSEAAKERSREGNGVGQDKDGEEAGKKQKVLMSDLGVPQVTCKMNNRWRENSDHPGHVESRTALFFTPYLKSISNFA